jgi:CheY-like chemotaxis protein
MEQSALTGKELLLIVEDNDEDFEALSRALQRLGINNPVRRCRDGEECLATLADAGRSADGVRSQQPGLILLDLNMPGTDGRDTLRLIKDDPRLKSIPVTILTTSSNRRDVEACYEWGANAYVLKPIDYDDLIESLRTVTDFWLRAVVLPPP